MSVKERLNECLKELKRADYSSDESARRSDAAASRLLALVWEGALTGVKFDSSERQKLRSQLAAATKPLRARCERLAVVYRTRLDDSVLRDRSSLQFLLDGFAGKKAASDLCQAGLDESADLLDTLIARWRDISSDSDSDDEEPHATQPHQGVPASHSWWSS